MRLARWLAARHLFRPFQFEWGADLTSGEAFGRAVSSVRWSEKGLQGRRIVREGCTDLRCRRLHSAVLAHSVSAERREGPDAPDTTGSAHPRFPLGSEEPGNLTHDRQTTPPDSRPSGGERGRRLGRVGWPSRRSTRAPQTPCARPPSRRSRARRDQRVFAFRVGGSRSSRPSRGADSGAISVVPSSTA